MFPLFCLAALWLGCERGGAGPSPATVATPRTIDVAAFGARGDGISDDTAAVQAALDAVPAAGGVVFFRPTSAAYRVRTVRPRSHSTLAGALPGSKLDIVDDGTRTGNSIYVKDVVDVTIRDLGISSSNATARTGVYGHIRIEHAERVKVVGCDLGRSSSVAIHVIDSSDLRFERNDIHDTFADGVHVSRGSRDVDIVANDIRDTGDDAIGAIGYIDAERAYPPMRRIQIAYNRIRNAGRERAGNGINIQGVVDADVRYNTIRGTQLSGVYVGATTSAAAGLTRYPRHVRILGNVIVGVGRGLPNCGVVVEGSREVRIEGNAIRKTSGDGILVTAAGRDIEILDNRIAATAGRGIFWSQRKSDDARLVAELKSDGDEPQPGGMGLSHGRIAGNAVADSGAEAIYVRGEAGAPVEAVQIEQNHAAGVAPGNAAISTCFAVSITQHDNRIPGATRTIDACPPTR